MWLPRLYRSLNKKQRQRLAEASKRLKVTTKKVSADGKVNVSRTQVWCYSYNVGYLVGSLSSSEKTLEFISTLIDIFLLVLRSGGKGLKATQVYPKAFGQRICQLHEELMVQPAQLNHHRLKTTRTYVFTF